MADHRQPSYNIYFERDDLDGAITCLEEFGYCVIRKMMGQDLVDELKDSIDENLDPHRDLPVASSRSHLTFAEVSEPLWKLLETAPYVNYLHKTHRTNDICLHRSAAILRTPGERMGGWHTDHRAHVKEPKEPNDVLNRYPIPNGNWFYLNGSHPERSGIAVIEKSHRPDWEGPEGFEFTFDRDGFHPKGDAPDASYSKMDVPGCIAVIADPGDLICFGAWTYHASMQTNERRYSCGFIFRSKSFQVDAPWPLPLAAKNMAARLPEHLRHYVDGYTSLDRAWTAQP